MRVRLDGTEEECATAQRALSSVPGLTVREAPELAGPEGPKGAGLLYGVAAVATAISADTSWRFFGEVLGITTPWERVAMFAILELFLIACGYGTRANVLRGGRPGAPQMVAWALCACSAYMAVMVSGPLAGAARVTFGPVFALVALHLALGIDIRVHRGQTGVWAKVGRELRERALSRLGLGDDERDALARTRDRARERAARLAVAGRWTLGRRRRLARAVRASGATLDLIQRQRLMIQVAALRDLDDLATVDIPSPWRVGKTLELADFCAVKDSAQKSSREPQKSAQNSGHGRQKSAGETAKVEPQNPSGKIGRPSNAAKVADFAAQNPGATAAEVAAEVGVSLDTARRHMRSLDTGFAAAPQKSSHVNGVMPHFADAS